MNKVENSTRKIVGEARTPGAMVESPHGYDPQAAIPHPAIDNHVLQSIRPAGLYETWHMEEAVAGIYLLYGHPQVLVLAQKLACQCLLQAEHLIIVDGANMFDPYLAARLATKMGRAPTDFLRSIRVSRSFTCHQMLSLVRQIEAAGRLWKSPFVLLLGPLTTFYDESVPHYEAWKLFRTFQRELKRLTAFGFRLLLSCQQPSAATKRDFVQQLKASARGIASCWEAELSVAPLPHFGGEWVKLDKLPQGRRDDSIFSHLQSGRGRLGQSPRMTTSTPLLKQEGPPGFSPGRKDISQGKYLLLKLEKPAEIQRQWVLRRGEKVSSRYLVL